MRLAVLLFAAGAACMTAAPVLAQSQRIPARPAAPEAPREVAEGKVFACEGNRRLVARMDTQTSGLVAIIDVGNGPKALPVQPWDGGEPKVTWSDGARTLTWNPGVQLHYTEGAVHMVCGRSLGEPHH